jgi:hypothetical protein
VTRRPGFEQWMAIAVALLVVVILGAGSASLARGRFFANDSEPGSSPITGGASGVSANVGCY